MSRLVSTIQVGFAKFAAFSKATDMICICPHGHHWSGSPRLVSSTEHSLLSPHLEAKSTEVKSVSNIQGVASPSRNA